MGKRTRTYVTMAIGRRSLRPHIPSAAQIRRGAYSASPAFSLTPMIVMVAFFSLCCGVAAATLSSEAVSITSTALVAVH